MTHIVELEHKLTQNRMEANSTANANEEESNYSKVRARIASRNKDIDILWKQGSSPYQVSEILGIHPEIVKARIAKLERDEEDRRRFMQTTKLPWEGESGSFAIYQS
jgi:DNA-binding CsgD family transcriptional regulator